jgi:hypothetical protein
MDFVRVDERRRGRAGVGRAHRVAQRLPRAALETFLKKAKEIGGLLLDGELEATGDVIRAEPDQLIQREDALSALAR